MAINEECGVFGVYSPNKSDLANIVYYGLYALQHRGQESCGIVVNQDGVFYSHKDLGLLNDVFSKDKLMNFPEANMAVGHVRYGTTGKTNRNNYFSIISTAFFVAWQTVKAEKNVYAYI